MRQAFAGMLWSKQLYTTTCAAGSTAIPASRATRVPAGRAATPGGARSDAFDIMSMPDKWEYPWFAAWDLAFHCVALAHVDPAFAKYQLTLLCREWFQHPNGALPAYEWDFGDVNPPVQAWAALEVFANRRRPRPRLPQPGVRQAAGELTWWVNRQDANRLEPVRGRLPGPGQHRPLDRTHASRSAARSEQSDATGWMAYALAWA
jgi:hypothetical protein